MINARLVPITNIELDCLLKEIDDKIFNIAANWLDHLRFGVQYKLNRSLYYKLKTYKLILTLKFNGCNCINVPLDVLISRVNHLIKSSC